jgi:dolichol kinase
MNLQIELLRAGIISVIYILIFIAAEMWHAFGKHQTETTRKFGHFASGAVYLSFLISINSGRPQFYLIAILVLALSDSLAALIGGQYGLKLYKVEEDHKSIME